MDTNTLLIVMVAITGSAVVIQAVALIVVAVAAAKVTKSAKSEIEDLRSKVIPVVQTSKELIDTTRALISRLEPKIMAAATDVAEIAETAKAQVARIQVATDEITERVRAASDDIADRVRHQAERVDGMTTSALNSVDRVGGFISHAVAVPVRQLSGVLAAARAVIDTLRAPAPPRPARPSSHITDEKDMFV
jgi:uncharacterized protein YoxC